MPVAVSRAPGGTRIPAPTSWWDCRIREVLSPLPSNRTAPSTDSPEIHTCRSLEALTRNGSGQHHGFEQGLKARDRLRLAVSPRSRPWSSRYRVCPREPLFAQATVQGAPSFWVLTRSAASLPLISCATPCDSLDCRKSNRAPIESSCAQNVNVCTRGCKISNSDPPPLAANL